MTLHTLEYITIGAYLLIMVGIGWAFRRFNQNVDDYFRSGNRGAWWLVGMSAFMSSFSAWTFTGAAGVAYQAGWSAAIVFIANASGFLLNFLCTGAWFRQLRATTGPEIIRLRFGPGTQQFYAGVNVLMGLLHGGLHLFGLAIFCAQVFGLPLNLFIIVIGLVVLIYSTVGGNWASLATDFVQGLILLPVTVLIAWLAIRAAGGLDGIKTLIAERGLTDQFALVKEPERTAAGAFTIGWISAMVLKNTITWNTLTSANRFFSVKDGRDARRAALLCTVLMLAGTCIWFVPPMVARLLYASQVNAAVLNKPAEAAYAVASLNLLPPGLIGLMVVAMFAATMSSMDSGLNRPAAIVIKDVYPALCRLRGRTPRSDAELFRASQVLTIVFGILVILLALYYASRKGEGVFEIMIDLGAYLGTPMAVPMFLGLFFQRVPQWAAFASAGGALLVSLGLALTQRLGAPAWSFQATVYLNLGVGSGVFFLSMLAWPRTGPAYREQVAAFFQRMHTSVDFEREVGGGTDLRQLNLLGCFAMATGALVMLLAPFTDSMAGALQTGFVAGTLVLTGVGMWFVSRRQT